MQGKILIGDHLTVLVCGIGDLDLILDGRGGMYTSQVLYVPHDGFHLLSVKELHELGLQVAFDVDQLRVRHGNSRSLVCEGQLQQGLYKLSLPTVPPHSSSLTPIRDSGLRASVTQVYDRRTKMQWCRACQTVG